MEYAGLEITTDNEVYEPAEDSFLAADTVLEELNKLEGGLNVIDIGCGSGILGLVAATNANVGKVLFVDTNDRALELCRVNINRNMGIVRADCDVVKSDLFAEVTGKFDMIIFNSPYLPSDEKEKSKDKLASAWSGGEAGIEVSKKFLHQVVSHMADGAEVILVVSSLGDVETLQNEINALGLYVAGEKKQHISFEDIIVMVIGKVSYIGS